MAKSRSRTPVYKGRFGQQQAERLLWRAGFGPRPGEAEALAKLGLKRAVRTLTRPRGADKLIGPAPVLENNEPLTPTDRWGHDHLWWFDRMVRTNHPLRERMTLVWHDWFATSNDGVGSAKLMIQQNKLLRKYALSSFEDMLLKLTPNPAMLIWLSGNENTKWAPNENYARELMELFTLGAEARYSERDVREQARALTGFTNDWGESGYERFRFRSDFHDNGIKRVFGKRGRFDWRDSCRMCLAHRDHPGFFVDKLWSYFIPGKIPAKTRAQLKRDYVRGGYRIRPVVESILMHPSLFNGPRMVKPPVVHQAGLLRMRNLGVNDDSWVWISEMCGQRLFYPPNVSGWNDKAWLDTQTYRGRWYAAQTAIARELLDPGDDAVTDNWNVDETAAEAVAAARAYWGDPMLSDTTVAQLTTFAQRVQDDAVSNWKKRPYRVMRQNALRTLIATSPDLQTS
jgi:uncharacterized protein (DUF1800 family)